MNSREPIYKRYHEEIKILLCFFIGFLLIRYDFTIKTSIFDFLFIIFSKIISFFKNIILFLLDRTLDITFYDFLGMCCILLASILSFYRIRNNLIKRHNIYHECPHCFTKLKRIHSTYYHMIIKTVFRLKTKNYLCPKCFFSDYKISKLKTK